METPEPDTAPAEETFAQALAALKDEYGVKEPAISDAVGVHVSTVNNWANGKAIPRAKYIRALAAAYPKFTEARLFAAAGKRPPAPFRADEREEVLDVFDRLTREQRRMLLLQANAVADSNEQ
ncbi:helix-turn-helix domain-containing protein [Streptomyces broussonetiae]|uniref:Helix-turn-helix domain-containing protein n=1 Tax=Streptomyces broussonetiae TaxID=2686304 RepID=A0ABV5E5N4_9ACTN